MAPAASGDELVGGRRPLISRKQLALRLGCSPHTLACWALQGRGVPMVKIGSRVFYRPEDVERFIAARTRSSTAEEIAPMAAG